MISDPEGGEVLILHMVDDATTFRMLEIVLDRGFEELRDGMMRWIAIFGPPRVLKVDRESAFTSERFKVWANQKSIKMEYLPSSHGGSTGAHTAAGVMESHQRVARTGVWVALARTPSSAGPEGGCRRHRRTKASSF